MSRRHLLFDAASGIASTRLTSGAAQTDNIRKPNLILFMPDQLRADSIGCYGHPIVRTPNIDRLASEGVRFQHCQSAYPVCTASRCSMLTGWPPHVRGHRNVYHLLRPEEPNLFRYLKRGGYDVFWFGKNDVLRADCFAESATSWASFVEGFEWDAKDNPWPADHRYYYSFLFRKGRDRRSYPDFARVRAAADVLSRRQAEKPFCIFLPLFFPHPPYAGPADFYDMYDPAKVPPLRPPGLKGKPALYEAIRRSRRLDQLTDADFRKINAVYLGMVSYVDWLLGELLEVVEKTGHVKDTAVLFCSDHGDWAGDYGLVEKWSSAMDDTLLHVPLVIRAPGGTREHKVEGMVELADIMPTILALAGIKAEHTHYAKNLLPDVFGSSGDPARAAFSEGGYNRYEPQCFEPLEAFPPSHIYYPKVHLENSRPELITRTTMIRTASAKLVFRPDGESEFYDLTHDPLELRNCFADSGFRTTREQLMARMLEWYVRTSDVTPAGRDDRALPPDHGVP